jgi:undecaprenyl-phosphate galactose phosphotransferase
VTFLYHSNTLLYYLGANLVALRNILMSDICCSSEISAKRIFDICVSFIAIIVILPITLPIFLLIMRDGGAPLFYHNRIGRGGVVFPCLKFRTMVLNSEEVLQEFLANNPKAALEWQETQKLQDDPRITSLGKILRKTSLDELPQLFNVLKGDMSLVGPRPIIAAEIVHYNHKISDYQMVRPGITGLWQVSGRSNISYEQRVNLDSWYVQNWSIWHDFTILLKTIPAVLRRDGAY